MLGSGDWGIGSGEWGLDKEEEEGEEEEELFESLAFASEFEGMGFGGWLWWAGAGCGSLKGSCWKMAREKLSRMGLVLV